MAMGSSHKEFTRNMLDPMNDFQKDALQGVLAFDLETFSPDVSPMILGIPLLIFRL
jgi:hypothetical protein